jgi:hypothetical protein
MVDTADLVLSGHTPADEHDVAPFRAGRFHLPDLASSAPAIR